MTKEKCPNFLESGNGTGRQEDLPKPFFPLSPSPGSRAKIENSPLITLPTRTNDYNYSCQFLQAIPLCKHSALYLWHEGDEHPEEERVGADVAALDEVDPVRGGRRGPVVVDLVRQVLDQVRHVCGGKRFTALEAGAAVEEGVSRACCRQGRRQLSLRR